MDFWTKLENLRSECNVLEHPFYQRWTAGDLQASELAHYAGEYHHAVVALAAILLSLVRASALTT